MSLIVELGIEKADLLYKQNAYCPVVLKNMSNKPVAVSVPPLDLTNPVVHVLDVQSGEEDDFQQPVSPKATSHSPGQLSPGDALKTGFDLLGIVSNLEPGTYDISIRWSYNGSMVATSNTQRIKVHPCTAKNLQLANAFGGHGDIKYGVWTNLAIDPNDKPKIIRCRFTLREGGGITEVMEVAEASVTCKPMLSSPVVGKVVDSQWVSWIEQSTLHFIHVDEKLGVSEKQSLPVNFNAVEIIPPLYSSEVEDTSVRPSAGLVLQHAIPETGQFRIDSVQLSPRGAKPLGHMLVPGDKPVWSMSHVRSSKQWLISYLQVHQNGLLLSYCPWPGFPTNHPEPVNLALWKSQFIRANASIDDQDVIHGGILMWKLPKDKPRRLVLESWTLKDDDIKTKELPLDWRPNQMIKDARVGVSDTGNLAVLIKDDEDTWSVSVGGSKFEPLPMSIQKSRQELELVFMEGDGAPLLISGTLSRGFQILQLDGSPLPPPVPKK